MKNLYLLSALLITSQLSCNELAWVSKEIAAIKPARVGISDREISKIKNPFIFLHKNNVLKSSKTKGEVSHTYYSKHEKVVQYRTLHFKLKAILNKSAMINGKWYKQGSYVEGYKLVKVNRKSALLMRKNKKILLSTVSRSDKIKINNN